MSRTHLTTEEAAASGWLTMAQLKAKKLQPKHGAHFKTVRQGHSDYRIYDPEQAEPYQAKTPPSVLLRRQVRDTARDILKTNPVLIDTETTGLGDDAEVIEISIIDVNGLVLFSSLVQCQGEIHAAASQVSGITHADLTGQPTWPEIHAQIAAIIADRDVVMYGAEFDDRLMQQTAQRHGLDLPAYRSHCAMRLYAQWWQQEGKEKGQWRWQRLSNAALQCGYTPDHSHRATSDCMTTLAIMKYVAKGKFRRTWPA